MRDSRASPSPCYFRLFWFLFSVLFCSPSSTRRPRSRHGYRLGLPIPTDLQYGMTLPVVSKWHRNSELYSEVYLVLLLLVVVVVRLLPVLLLSPPPCSATAPCSLGDLIEPMLPQPEPRTLGIVYNPMSVLCRPFGHAVYLDGASNMPSVACLLPMQSVESVECTQARTPFPRVSLCLRSLVDG
ncbi:hypothetical protein F5B17DRAFT_271057 [Nemania serpens]|nr:hypothetical protein F5B17DRAFT_271057 [Nemania serpens]